MAKLLNNRHIYQANRSRHRVQEGGLLNGLIGYWPCTEGCGQTLYDWVGANDFALTGGVDWRGLGDPRFHTSPYFDGSNDFGVASVNLSGGNMATYACWFWWSNWSEGGSRFLFEHTTDINLTQGGIFVEPCEPTNISNLFWFAGKGNTGYVNGGFTRPTVYKWYSLAIHQDSGQSVNELNDAYLDGVQKTISGRIDNLNNTNGLANANMYLFSRAGTNVWGSGSIAHIAIWNRKLSAEEFQRVGTDPFAIMRDMALEPQQSLRAHQASKRRFVVPQAAGGAVRSNQFLPLLGVG